MPATTGPSWALKLFIDFCFVLLKSQELGGGLYFRACAPAALAELIEPSWVQITFAFADKGRDIITVVWYPYFVSRI